MIDTNSDMRFMSNNYLLTGYTSFEISSLSPNFLKASMLTDQRSKVCRFGGRFLIDSTNNKIYIGGVTYTLTADDYADADALCDAVNTLLTSISVTLVYNSNTRVFYFHRLSAFTLTLSSTTNSIWQTLGYYSVVDLPATLTSGEYYADADVGRIHWPYEQIDIDFGYQANLGFVGIITDLSQNLTIPENAVVRFMANTINSFGAPVIDKALEWKSKAIFTFFDDVENTACRYVRITIECPDAEQHPEIGYLYVGDYGGFENRNIKTGIDFSYDDRSELSTSESGQVYANKKTPVRVFNSMGVGLVSPENLNYLKEIYALKQITSPFFVSLDPKTLITENSDDFLFFGRFINAPKFKHIINNIYDIDFDLKEAM